MNINFNDSTFEKLRFLADREGRSVAAFVSMRMDELTGQLVNTQYTVNELPPGVELAHLDSTPRPAPKVVYSSESGTQYDYAAFHHPSQELI